jgi:hypothetical protein
MSQENKYTKPELRERIKDRVMAGSKGGKPGQWSARKAQLVASEYKEAGGGYKGGKGEKQKVFGEVGQRKVDDQRTSMRRGARLKLQPRSTRRVK